MNECFPAYWAGRQIKEFCEKHTWHSVPRLAGTIPGKPIKFMFWVCKRCQWTIRIDELFIEHRKTLSLKNHKFGVEVPPYRHGEVIQNLNRTKSHLTPKIKDMLKRDPKHTDIDLTPGPPPTTNGKH